MGLPEDRLLAAATTRTGSRHEENHDAYALLDDRHPSVRVAERGAIYAVADGVASTPGAAWASRLACEALLRFFETTRPPSEDLLLDVIETADAEVRMASGGATTLAGVWFHGETATVFAVGDSLLHRIRHGRMERLTIADHRGRGLAAWIGMGPEVRRVVQLRRHLLRAGDTYLLVTDGVVEALGEQRLRHAFHLAPDARGWVEEVEAWLDRVVPRDDATAMAAQVVPPGIPLEPPGQEDVNCEQERSPPCPNTLPPA